MTGDSGKFEHTDYSNKFYVPVGVVKDQSIFQWVMTKLIFLWVVLFYAIYQVYFV